MKMDAVDERRERLLNKVQLSVCMIVKDEEQWIGRCLASIRPYAGEIIVVDTGSHDQTAAIVQSLGGRILPFEWTGSFADARNFGLEHATGEWIMWLDADEEVDVQQASHLLELHQYKKSNLLAVEMIHFNGALHPHPDEAYRMVHHRLFRNGKGFYFTGDIHEQLSNSRTDMVQEVEQCEILPVTVLHYGYLEAVADTKHKFSRNFSILQKKLAEMQEPDPWLMYHLASEYYRKKDYNTAIDQLNLAIRMALAQGMLPPPLFYKLKYASLLEAKQFEAAWSGIDKAILLYPDYVDLHFYKGCILLQLGKAELALPAFEECLRLGDVHPHYMILQGAGSFYTFYYLGLCYAQLKAPHKASQMYIKALERSPHFSEARQELERVRASEHSISCLVDSSSSAFLPDSMQPITDPYPVVIAARLTIGTMLIPGGNGPDRLDQWLKEWDAYADEWLIVDCGLQREEKAVARRYAHQLVAYNNSNSEWAKPGIVLRETASCEYFLWLHPADRLTPGASQELDALRQWLDAQDGRKMDAISFQLSWPNPETDDSTGWTVTRNRLVRKAAIADWNPQLEEFLLPPGALVQESGIRLQFDRGLGRKQLNTLSESS